MEITGADLRRFICLKKRFSALYLDYTSHSLFEYCTPTIIVLMIGDTPCKK